MIRPQKSRFITGESIINMALVLFALFILIESRDYSLEARRFPQVVASITAILGIYLIIRDYIKVKKSHEAVIEEKGTEREKCKESNNSPLIIIAVGILYFIFFRFLGFIISTFILMSVVPILLGYKNYKIIFLLSVVLTIGLYWIFTTFFYIPLPKGILF